MSDAQIVELSAAAAAAALARGELSSRELFETYRARATADRAAGAEGLNCFTWVADAAPLEDGRGQLGGVPLAVKDLFCVEGVPSQAGSRILEGYQPPYTATAVAK